MKTTDPCECRACSEARMLAAWCLLADADDNEPRWAANLLLRRWERAADEGGSPLNSMPKKSEVEAMQICAKWIREHEGSLRHLHRHVGVSGSPPA